jgi:hypothetical protein
MMERTATFSKSNTPEEYAPWKATTITSGEQIPQEKVLRLIEAPSLTTSAFWATANAPANPTTPSQFIVLQTTAIGAEDTSGTSIVFIAQGNISSLGEATGTYVRYGYDHPRLLFGNLGYPEVQIWYQPIALPESPWISTEVIQEEERETIHADTDRALSFDELLSALDKISRPMEVEDVPLSVDPDDYPVV